MHSVGTEVVVVILLVLANGVLAMSEMALVSARKVRLHRMAGEGDQGAKLALEIANAPNEFLSTVQIGITLVGIMTGAFGGATIARELTQYFSSIPVVSSYAEPLAFTTVVVVIGYLSLIVGELVPKRLALHSPENISRIVAGPMRLLSQLAKPVVFLLSGSTNLVLRAFAIQPRNEPGVTEAEIQVLVDQATESGVFEEAEQEMVESVLSLGDRKVASLMMPRTEIEWLDVSATDDEMLELLDKAKYSRFPVADGSLDQVLGIVESRAILRRLIGGQPVKLDTLVTQPAYVPESTTALELLERFRDSKQHLVIVMDEYGGVQGLVTRDDLFEAIVGQLPMHDEAPRWEAHQREDGSWLLDGQMPVQEFQEILKLDSLPGGDVADYHTLAGFILCHLQCIPQIGDQFEWRDLHFEIVDMDWHRIDKVIVSKIEH